MNKNGEKIQELPLKVQIIKSLLINEKRSTGELADYCGFNEYGNAKFNHVLRPLRELQAKTIKESKKQVPQKKYIISTLGQKTKTKAPTNYNIIQELDTIRALYYDKDYDSIKEDFQRSAWLRNLILKENFKITIDHENFPQDMHIMLENSATFFEIFLNNRYDDDNINRLKHVATCPIIHKSVFFEGRGIESRSKSIMYLLYSLFITCIIVDSLYEGNIIQIPKDLQKIVQEIKEKALANYKKAQQYQDTFLIMNALRRFISHYHANNDTINEEIIDSFKKYENLLYNFHTNDERFQELSEAQEYSLDVIYDDIAAKLSLPYRRRQGGIYEILELPLLDKDTILKIEKG